MTEDEKLTDGGAQARSGNYLRDVQRMTAAWREETLEGDPTSLSQAAHTSVEANELLDLLVKGETYGSDLDDRHVMEEAGDVIVAHLGTLELLGLDPVDCVEAALEKNGSRDWGDWQR